MNESMLTSSKDHSKIGRKKIVYLYKLFGMDKLIFDS